MGKKEVDFVQRYDNLNSLINIILHLNNIKGKLLL